MTNSLSPWAWAEFMFLWLDELTPERLRRIGSIIGNAGYYIVDVAKSEGGIQVGNAGRNVIDSFAETIACRDGIEFIREGGTFFVHFAEAIDTPEAHLALSYGFTTVRKFFKLLGSDEMQDLLLNTNDLLSKLAELASRPETNLAIARFVAKVTAKLEEEAQTFGKGRKTIKLKRTVSKQELLQNLYERMENDANNESKEDIDSSHKESNVNNIKSGSPISNSEKARLHIAAEGMVSYLGGGEKKEEEETSIDSEEVDTSDDDIDMKSDNTHNDESDSNRKSEDENLNLVSQHESLDTENYRTGLRRRIAKKNSRKDDVPKVAPTQFKDEDDIPFELRVDGYLAKERVAAQRRVETKQSLESRWSKWFDIVNKSRNKEENHDTQVQKSSGKKGSLVLFSFFFFLLWTFLGFAGFYFTVLKPTIFLITGK